MRDSPVREYFEHDVASDKSVCIVTGRGKSRRRKFRGKNSSEVGHLVLVNLDAFKPNNENEPSRKMTKLD
jgi:hypothetical protein